MFDTTPLMSPTVSNPPLPPPFPNPPKTPPGYSANAELAVSSNASDPKSAILWALSPNSNPNDTSSGGKGTLLAFDANTLEWLFATDPSAMNAPNYAKYDVPTIANGKVYVPTRSEDVDTRDNHILVYALPRKRRAVRPV